MTKKEEKKDSKKIKKENNTKTSNTKETKKKNNTKTSNTKKTTKEKQKEKKHFFKDVKGELKKVRWPLKKEMIKYSIATLIFMVILGLFFVAADLIIAGIRMVFI